MFIRTLLFLVGLTTALTQISTIINCVQPDLVNYLCLVCRPNFQLTAGQCRQCVSGYTLSNGNCVKSSAATTSRTTSAQNTPPPTPTATTTHTQTNTPTGNTAGTASQLNTILQLIATNPGMAVQLQPILLQLLAQNSAATPTTPTPTTIPPLTNTPSPSPSTTTPSSSSSASSPPRTSSTTTTTTTPGSPTPTTTPTSNTQNTGSSSVFLPFASQTIPSGSGALRAPTSFSASSIPTA